MQPTALGVPENAPARQGKHALAPPAAEYDPAAHAAQAPLVAAPLAEEKKPAEHAAHASVPAPLVNVPAAQGAQADEPGTPEYAHDGFFFAQRI